MARGIAVSVDLEKGTRAVADAPDLHPDEIAAEAAHRAQLDREGRRRAKLRALKAKFRAGSSSASDRDKALAILCGMALQDLAEDEDNGT